MHHQIERQTERIEKLYEQARNLGASTEIDDEIKSHFVKYLCIQTSSYIDGAVKTVLREYTQASAEAYIANFVSSFLKRTPNPSKDYISKLLARFNKEWGVSFRRRTHERIGPSLDSIVNNRNQIAHGKDVDLTLRQLEKYYDDAKEVINIVDNICNTP